MIPYQNRFHGHGSLRYVYRNGAVARSRFATLKFTLNPKRKTPRLAVVVSKKILKGAVKRNRLRRRVYEYLRLEMPKLKSNADVVIIISSAELLGMAYPELRDQIGQLIASSGLYK